MTEKQSPKLKGKSVEQFLQELEENLMIDDHGIAIIGDRSKQPKETTDR
ncbi:MAG: hypothetical protein JSS32_10260 [Verrucomicrobia bacterium]|nr:hypothetical protein [Verrucomicrobiota bacterium]